LVERVLGKDEVTSSTLVIGSTFTFLSATVIFHQPVFSLHLHAVSGDLEYSSDWDWP
jgi:hypothetical protein